LADLAGADFAGSTGDDSTELGRAMFSGEDECVGKERIAEKHGRMGAVSTVGRVGAMALIGAVEDVVMDQRGQVDKFDDTRATDECIAGWPACSRGENQQRAKTFARVSEHLADHGPQFRLKNGLLGVKKNF